MAAPKGSKHHFKHGMTGTPIWVSWQAMWGRCTNPKNPRYASHGGRGIKVCSQWKEFDQFLLDMGERPAGTSLDRKDNDGDYAPDNCRWATPTEQASNTRSVKLMTHKGVTDSQAGWARRIGITPHTLCKRLKRGWPLADALQP